MGCSVGKGPPRSHFQEVWRPHRKTDSETQQWLAADGAIALFSSNLFLLSLYADRAPQLKPSVRPMKTLTS